MSGCVTGDSSGFLTSAWKKKKKTVTHWKAQRDLSLGPLSLRCGQLFVRGPRSGKCCLHLGQKKKKTRNALIIRRASFASRLFNLIVIWNFDVCRTCSKILMSSRESQNRSVLGSSINPAPLRWIRLVFQADRLWTRSSKKKIIIPGTGFGRLRVLDQLIDVIRKHDNMIVIDFEWTSNDP
jgi:hypothetical protein